MEKQYQIVRVIERKNKENKTYYLAIVLFNNHYDSDLLRILVTEEQADKLLDIIGSEEDDITSFIAIDYNSYQKNFQPKITI